MKTYPKYKPTGVNWISTIPEHWEIRKISRSFKVIGSGTTPPAGSEVYYNEGTINWINTGDLNDSVLTSCSKKITQQALDEFSTLRVYPEGSVIIALYGATIGKLSILAIQGCTNQACCVLTSSDHYDNKYMFFWLLSERPHIISLASGGGQPNISQELIRSLRVFCPPITEQTTIAAYLDQKTALIDDTISKKQQLIALLQEERTALINKVVTRGLDDSVPTKPSGVEWLGEIPGHWEVKKLKYVAEINPSKHKFSEEELNSDVVFLPMEKVSESGVITQDIFKKTETLINGFTFFKRNDVLVAKITPCFENGKGGLLKDLLTEYGFGSTEFHVLRASRKIRQEFLLHLTKTDIFKSFGEAFMVGAAGQKRVPTDFLEDFPVALPSLEDQDEMLVYIEEKVRSFDSTASKIECELSLLQEYRTALVNEVVTGKICVL